MLRTLIVWLVVAHDLKSTDPRVTSVQLVFFVLFNMAGGFQKMFARLFWVKQVKVSKKA